jgi:hypothetical protein
MLIRVLSCALLVAAIAPGLQSDAWSQAVPAKEGGMLTPPPVSVDAYPKEVGSEVRSNYLRVGANFSTAYIDNLYAGSKNAVVSETTYSIWPTIAFDETSYRQHGSVVYSAGFTFYHPTSSLNSIDHNAVLSYRFRLTPHLTMNANDTFQRGAASFAAFSAGGGISGSGSSSAPGVVAPYANRLTNTANAELSLQYSPTSMIGVSGRLFNLHYPNASEVPGLYDSDDRGGAAFYNHRITDTQYAGMTYRYSRIQAFPQDAQNETQAHTINLFYTIYLKQSISFSISGGPQYYDSHASVPNSASSAHVVMTSLVRRSSDTRSFGPQQTGTAQTSTLTTNSWSPAITASMGWQQRHTSFAARYSRGVAAGGGFLGTFDSNSASALARWQISRTWTIGASANYELIKALTPLLYSSTLGGHTVSGMATVEHPINDHFNLAFEYDRLHQSYNGIAVIAGNPDSDRGMASLSWRFARPIGR